MLTSICHEYLETIVNLRNGNYIENHQIHDLEQQRGLLHAQLLSLVNADDYEAALSDTYHYAIQVIEWSTRKAA